MENSKTLIDDGVRNCSHQEDADAELSAHASLEASLVLSTPPLETSSVATSPEIPTCAKLGDVERDGGVSALNGPSKEPLAPEEQATGPEVKVSPEDEAI